MNTTSPRKKNVERKGNLNSYVKENIENKPVGTLKRANVFLEFCIMHWETIPFI